METIFLEKLTKKKNPASFGGVSRLVEAARIPFKTARKWLALQDTYALHKSMGRKFRRRKVVAYGIGELMQCDLMDL